MKEAIKDLDIFISDGNYSSKYPRSDEFVEEGIPFIRGNNMIEGDIDDTEMYYITPEKHEILKKGHVKGGDVLITTRGNIGQVAIVPERHEDSNINAQIVLLRPNPEEIYNRYLLWALQSRSSKEQFCSLQTGTALKQLPVGKLEQVEIYKPDIELQYEIAERLDKVYRLIQERTKELELLDELIKARFVELFGDPRINPLGYDTKELGQTCTVITGNTPSRKVPEYYGDYMEWIKTDNIVSGMLNPTEAAECLSKSGVNEGRCVDENAILMACIAGSIASIGRVCVTDRRVAFNQQINAIVPGEYNTLFLCILLQISKDYLVEDINMALKGILSKSKLEEKVFIVPPIELQNQFADFVKQVDKSKVVVQKALDEAQTLFDSLMQEYFG